MSIETQWVLVLAAFCLVLLVIGTVIAKILSTAPPRVLRTVWPIVALLTGVCYAVLVYAARVHVKG